MTRLEIDKMISQEANKLYPKDNGAIPWNDPYRGRELTAQYNQRQQVRREIYIAGATFYEQSVLPKLYKPGEDWFEGWSFGLINFLNSPNGLWINNEKCIQIRDYVKTQIVDKFLVDGSQMSAELSWQSDKITSLQSQLSQLQLQMEEKRKADAEKWISVSDSTPEDGVEVLILTKHGGIEKGCRWWEQGRNPEHWRYYDIGGSVRLEPEDVTHWMPLPKSNEL